MLGFAISELAAFGTIQQLSPIVESEAWGYEDPNPYLNQIVELQTSLSPFILLNQLLAIEKLAGRIRSDTGPRYVPRSLDLDILLYDNQIIDTKELVVPHPRMHLRKFILFPLEKIAPNAVHPVSGYTISELLEVCTDNSFVQFVTDI